MAARKKPQPIVPASLALSNVIPVRRDQDHRYWIETQWGEREALSVTRTLVEQNLVDDEFFTDLGRGRGKLVHFFCERIFTNTLGPLELPDHVAGYLVALRKFLDKYAPTILLTEAIRASELRMYAGGLDLVCRNLAGIGSGEVVIEIKTSNPTPWHGLQLAPYANLYAGPKWLNVGRFGLYLKPTGGYRFKQYDDVRDLDRFFNALELLHWRVTNGSSIKPYGRRSSPEGFGGIESDNVVDDEAGGYGTDSLDLDPAGWFDYSGSVEEPDHGDRSDDR
jgi:hypothetical protein